MYISSGTARAAALGRPQIASGQDASPLYRAKSRDSCALRREQRNSKGIERRGFTPMAALTKLSVSDYWRLIYPFALLIIIGLVAAHYPESWPWTKQIDRLSDALIVAGLIGVVVELSSLNRLIEHVGRDVASRVTGMHLPTELRRQMSQIVETSLVLEDYTRSYRLHLENGKMVVESTLTYNVRNYGFTVQEYSPMLADEAFHNPTFLNVEYRLTNGDGYAFSEQQLALLTTQRQTRARCVDQLPKVALRPRAQVPDEVCRVTWQYKTIMPEEYSDITAFGAPTINPTIRVDAKPKDIDFFSDGEDVQHVPGGSEWVFKRPFIQGQHVRVWWQRQEGVSALENIRAATPLPK